MDLEKVMRPMRLEDPQSPLRTAALREVEAVWKLCLQNWPEAAKELSFSEMLELVRTVLTQTKTPVI